MRLAGALVDHEKGLAGGLLAQEALPIVGANFIGALRNGWAYCRGDALALSAKLLHGGNGRLDDARQRATPAGMRRADDARLAVAEQDRGAICGQRADGEPGGSRDDGVGLWRLAVGPRRLHDHRLGAMDLVEPQQTVRRHAQPLRPPGAVLGDIVGPVARAES